MKLTFEQVCSVTTGAVSVEQMADGIHFFRFNQEQLTYNKVTCRQEQAVAFGKKLLATSGIKLSFRTDSRTLKVCADMSFATGRTYYALDVVVDGVLVGGIDNYAQTEMPGNYAEYNFGPGEDTVELNLGEGEKEVCIHLPWGARTVLQELTLEDGASLIPVIPSKKLLAFGDSITQGYDALRPSNRYIARLAQALDAQEYNKAIGGAVAFPELARAREDFEPDYVVVAYGTNDWRFITQEDFCDRYSAMLDAIYDNYPSAQVFLITPIWRKDTDAESRWERFDLVEQCIRNAAARISNATVLCGIDLVPHDEGYYADLRLHPNDAGFDCYFERLWPEVKAALKG